MTSLSPSPRRACFLVLALACVPALGQAEMQVTPADDAPEWIVESPGGNLAPDDPRLEEYRQQQKRRVEIERELRVIRGKHFRSSRNTENRQVGIRKLFEYTDPAAFEPLTEIFAREKDDVRGAVLDHLADQKSDYADATLAWVAVFAEDPAYRALATDRLTRRDAGESLMVRSVVAEGLRRSDDGEVTAAAQLASRLKMFEAIPMLIAAQVQGGGAGINSAPGRSGSLAWIMVGTQQAFVSDLQPVVGDSAVAFDPTISVVTSGTVLRVIDAVVVTYRVDVHNALVDLSSAGWGRSTAHLGWDQKAWADWWTKDFKPALAAKPNADPKPGG